MTKRLSVLVGALALCSGVAMCSGCGGVHTLVQSTLPARTVKATLGETTEQEIVDALGKPDMRYESMPQGKHRVDMSFKPSLYGAKIIVTQCQPGGDPCVTVEKTTGIPATFSFVEGVLVHMY